MKVEKYEIPDSAKTYKPKDPFYATVISNERLTEADSAEDIRNIIFDISGSDMQYIEGQSIGIIPPGTQENGKPHRTRLYSIASSRMGDSGSSSTVTLCVKRVLFNDSDSGEEVRGLASNYICDLQAGEKVAFMGPTGRTFFLPQDHSTHLVMVAAGTGIAPFRAFIHHLYKEHKDWSGNVRLFFGTKSGMESLYMNRQNDDIGQYMSEKTFKAFQAISRHDTELPDDGNAKHGYVQDQILDNVDEIWKYFSAGNFSFYLCGMKAMEQGVMDVFRQRAEAEGKDWDEMQKDFKKQGRWNVEVY
jgi:ferredoxin--NADP+ reductase